MILFFLYSILIYIVHYFFLFIVIWVYYTWFISCWETFLTLWFTQSFILSHISILKILFYIQCIYFCCIIDEIIRPIKLKFFSAIKHHCVVYCTCIISFQLSTQCGKLCVGCWCVLFVVLHSKSIFFLQEYSLFLFYCACKLTLW